MNEILRWSRNHPFHTSLLAVTLAATIVDLFDSNGGVVWMLYTVAVAVLALAHRRISRRRGHVPGLYPRPPALVAAAVSGAAFGYAEGETVQAAAKGALWMMSLIWVMHVVARAIGPDGFRRRARPDTGDVAPVEVITEQDDVTDAQPHIEPDEASAGSFAAAAVAGIIAVTIVWAKSSESALLALAVIWAVAVVVPLSGAYLSRLSRRHRRSRRNA